MKDILENVQAAAVEGVADFVHSLAASKPMYPEDHKAGMKVPKGGSSCASCEYLVKQNEGDLPGKVQCNNKYFIKWNGSSIIPAPADEYCSDWYEHEKAIKAAEEVALNGDHKGSLWHGIKITGFTGPQEEGLRAMLSRIPPELFTGIAEIKSAEELNAKHGRYTPETKIMLFNPTNFRLRQRFGKGDGWIYHAEMTVIHEVGHAIYESFTEEQKKVWMDLGGWQIGWDVGQSLAYHEVRPGWPKDVSKWTHKAGIRVPRHYSERNPNECFADCFAFYILNKQHQMEPSFKKYIDQLIKDRVKRYPSALIAGPSKPYTETIKK